MSTTVSTNKSAASIIPVALVCVVLLMMVPLPPLMLDALLALSIGIALALTMVAIHLENPLELSSFPTILLFGTLLRLSLNVASTRLILLQGSEGTVAAGHVIQAFGEFIVQGNYVVGGAVFILLVIINFVVITKGAGRVAEVSARFALDSLPGKQMSIDSDLAAGAITQDEARGRRQELEQASEFFGSMDGASKFVRGDAIAGLLMTGVNIIVGFIVGVAQQDLEFTEAASTYTILAVGDGLASQIPALLVSTAAAVVVTKVSSDGSLTSDLIKQLSAKKEAVGTAAIMLGALGLMPGLPLIPFAGLGLALFAFSRSKTVSDSTPRLEGGNAKGTEKGQEQPKTEREKIEEMLPVELLELEVGFDLVPLVDPTKGGELVERISSIRENLALELGIIIPSVHIKDNLRLKSNEYRLLLSGSEIGRGSLRVGKLLAMDGTEDPKGIKGELVKEPAFGIPARWVASSDRQTAEANGYTVVDAATVAATHITEMLRSVSPELLGRSELQDLVDIFSRRYPQLIDDLIPATVTMNDLLQILRMLLRESVSVRDFRTVLEAIAENAKDARSNAELVEKIRQRMGRQITGRFQDQNRNVSALVLDPSAEDFFREGQPDVHQARNILSSIDKASKNFTSITTPPVVICAPDIRSAVSDFVSKRIPGLSVLSFQELDPKTTVKTLGLIAAH